ncbi:hypothetical protein K3181_02255 [Qipengyuania sp. YG27]|uniref:Uncharacterized protein n=1 Tax=Qipengyuania mesophila TaxID=2867246 RepID=A0ABS7JRN5_9SPHN|nr:hypothetical protein [Qipengyuania mesophila]MBX7500266.1 hypothetical protein [Qipengyuania mesophila]
MTNTVSLAEGEGEGQNEGSATQKQPSPPEVVATESAIEAPNYEHPCDYPYSREDSDLCAQWTAATAAREAADWLPFQAKIGTIEAIGILLSLIISTLSALAAFRALSSSRNAEERQNRAYVFPDQIQVSSRNAPGVKASLRGIPMAALVIKNSGQTPAYNLVHWTGFELIPVEDEASLTVPKLERVSANTLPPGGVNHKPVFMDRRLTNEEKKSVRRGAMGLFVYGRIEFEDAFGIERFTNYRLVYTGQWPPPEGASCFFSTGGNNSN